VKYLADKNAILLDGEKNVVGFVAVAAKSAPEVAGRAADAGKLRKKLKCVLKTPLCNGPSEAFRNSGGSRSTQRQAPPGHSAKI